MFSTFSINGSMNGMNKKKIVQGLLSVLGISMSIGLIGVEGAHSKPSIIKYNKNEHNTIINEHIRMINKTNEYINKANEYNRAINESYRSLEAREELDALRKMQRQMQRR